MEVARLMEENGHVTEVASLMEGELSCHRGGHCSGRRIVILQFNGGKMMLQFNGGSMVILQRWKF